MKAPFTVSGKESVPLSVSVTRAPALRPDSCPPMTKVALAGVAEGSSLEQAASSSYRAAAQ